MMDTTRDERVKEKSYCNGYGGWCHFRKPNGMLNYELCLNKEPCRCKIQEKEVKMSPDIKKIDEAIKAVESTKEIFNNNEFDSALSVLQHVREHGLALTEMEMGLIIRHKLLNDEFYQGSPLGVSMRIAQAITDRQRGV